MHSKRAVGSVCAMSWLGLSLLVAAQTPPASLADTMTDAFKKRLADYVVSHYQTPEDFVASQFKDHDIVFIGEHHNISQNLDFLQALIPRLAGSGVYNLGFEFALYEDQAKLDKWITAETFDEDLAREISYQRSAVVYVVERIGVFRAVWQVNRQRPKGARTFRIVGLNRLDGTELLPKDTPLEEMLRVSDKFLGGHRRDMVNRDWTDVISKEFIAKGEKAAIYCGSGHSNTKFRLDRRPMTAHFTSMGNFIYNYIGDRAMTVIMHQGLVEFPKDKNDSAFTAIERLMEGVPKQYRRVALSTAGTPFGDLPIPAVMGYREGRSSGFRMADYCDGYVFLVPESEFRPTTSLRKK